MQVQYQRQTAYKVWISDLLKNDVLKGEGEFGMHYVLIKNKRISRVNLIGFVVERYFNNINHISFVLDDKSGRIMLKAWNDDVNAFKNIEIGDLVLVIGKIKSGNERYIAPEVIKRLDNSLWARLRHGELARMYGKPIRDEFNIEAKEEMIVEPGESVRQKVLSVIEHNDKGNGVGFNDIFLFVNCEEGSLREIVDTLIKEGEIFEKGWMFKLVG